MTLSRIMSITYHIRESNPVDADVASDVQVANSLLCQAVIEVSEVIVVDINLAQNVKTDK